MNIREINGKLSIFFSTRPEIKFAYLFGSEAKNRTTALSDVDIAVYLDETLDEYKRFDIRLALICDVCGLLKRGDIDLVVLNDTPLSLSYRVVREGKVVYCKDERKRIRFEVKIMTMYFDRKHYYDRHTKLSIDSIAKEGVL